MKAARNCYPDYMPPNQKEVKDTILKESYDMNRAEDDHLLKINEGVFGLTIQGMEQPLRNFFY